MDSALQTFPQALTAAQVYRDPQSQGMIAIGTVGPGKIRRPQGRNRLTPKEGVYE